MQKIRSIIALAILSLCFLQSAPAQAAAGDWTTISANIATNFNPGVSNSVLISTAGTGFIWPQGDKIAMQGGIPWQVICGSTNAGLSNLWIGVENSLDGTTYTTGGISGTNPAITLQVQLNGSTQVVYRGWLPYTNFAGIRKGKVVSLRTSQTNGTWLYSLSFGGIVPISGFQWP